MSAAAIAVYVARARGGALPILLSGLQACERCPESVIQVTGSTTAGTVGDVFTSIAAIVARGRGDLGPRRPLARREPARSAACSLRCCGPGWP